MVYATSDLHGAFDIHKINPDEFIAGRTMTADDYLIVCGDFGCIWDGGSSDRFWLNWLESLPWTTVFIDGNHENFEVLETYPAETWKGGTIRRIRSNIVYLMRGERYEFGGRTWLAAGGGFSHDVALRTEGVNWWPQEIFSAAEQQHALETLEKAGGKVDIVLSHDVYASHPLAARYPVDLSRYPQDRVDQHQALDTIRQKADYSLWLCGHYHKDRLDFSDGKPCWMLFDQVLPIETLLEKARQAQSEPAG